MKRLLLLCVLLLAGCETPPKPAPHVVVTPTGPQTDAQLAAFRQQIEILTVQVQTLRDMADRASAAVYGVQNANPYNAPGLARDAVDAQAAEAASALPEPSAEKKLEKERQNAAILAGDLARVKAEMGQTMTENQALRASLASTEAQAAEAARKLADATKAAEIERNNAQATLQKQFNEMTAQIQAEQRKVEQARDEQRKSMMAKLGYVLLGLGVVFTLIGAFQAYATVQAGDITPKGFLKPLVWAGSAAFCFACYWTINQPWFKWLVIIGSGLAALAFGLFLYSEWREAKERKAGKLRSQEADEAEQTLHQMITAIDQLPETATVKELQEEFRKKMDAPNKALVLELKAEAKRTAA